MCGGAPDVPTPPERQDARTPERAPKGGSNDSALRRRGYAAMIKTASAGGDLSPVSTTGGAAKQNLGA